MSRIAFRLRRQRAWVLIVAAFLLLGPAAQAAPKYGNALDWAPADAAFYSASLRLGEQIEIIGQSNAWAKLVSLPAVQMGWQFFQMGYNRPGGPGDEIQQFLAQPENQQLWDLIVDGLSHEIVVYGDQSSADFIDTAQRALNAIRFGSMADNARQGGASDREMATGRTVLAALDAQRDRLSAPGIVIALKLTDAARAKEQLARLEKVLQSIFEDEPKLKDRLKHATAGGVDYLVLELDGSLVPWENIPWEKLAQKPGQFDKLRSKLEQLKMVVCAGVRGDYLLFSLGSSLAALEKLGSGKLLTDLPEFQPLEKFAEARLTGIGYASEGFMQAVSSSDQQLDQLLQTLRQVLPRAGLRDDDNEQILKDAEELSGDVKAILPKPGPRLAFSFLNGHGIEGYQYDWTRNAHLDGSKPLSLLEHVGGNPLMAYVAREIYSPKQYEMLRKWVRKGFGYFEEFAVPTMSASDRKTYEKLKETATPLVERLDIATGQMLLPGLADGQAAMVFDAKIISRQWFNGLQQNNRPLPMFEPALVFGVSDADLVKKAFVEYQAVADDIVKEVKLFDPKSIPPSFTIARPEIHETAAGVDFSYPFPQDLGVDSQLALGGGLESKVAVLSVAPAHTSQLLADAALNVSPTGPLADRKRALAAAFYFNSAATIEAATPWIHLAARKITAKSAEAAAAGMFLTDDSSRPELQPADDDPSAKFVLDQVQTVLEVLKTLRTVESATYLENGAMVTHSMSEFRDVP